MIDLLSRYKLIEFIRNIDSWRKSEKAAFIVLQKAF